MESASPVIVLVLGVGLALVLTSKRTSTENRWDLLRTILKNLAALFSPLILAGFHKIFLSPTEPDWFQPYGWIQIFVLAGGLPLLILINLLQRLFGSKKE